MPPGGARLRGSLQHTHQGVLLVSVSGHLDAHRRQELVGRLAQEPMQGHHGQGRAATARLEEVHRRLERTSREVVPARQYERGRKRHPTQFGQLF